MRQQWRSSKNFCSVRNKSVASVTCSDYTCVHLLSQCQCLHYKCYLACNWTLAWRQRGQWLIDWAMAWTTSDYSTEWNMKTQKHNTLITHKLLSFSYFKLLTNLQRQASIHGWYREAPVSFHTLPTRWLTDKLQQVGSFLRVAQLVQKYPTHEDSLPCQQPDNCSYSGPYKSSTHPPISQISNDHSLKHDDCLPEQREDVSRTGWILATRKPSTKLANRLQEVDVVATDKILCQVDNCGHEWLFTMMIWRMFSNWTSQLSHLDFTFVIAFQTSEQHLQDI